MDSIEEIHREIKKKWLFVSMKPIEKISGVTDVVKGVGKNLSELFPKQINSLANSLFSLDILDFVKIEPNIGDKKVILIFDDLERSGLAMIDLLGCINEYCENLHFNTIVVANEAKIDTQEKYSEIKEKIIKRTLLYHLNYSDVVSSVIASFEDSDYKSFLINHKESIVYIFSGNGLDDLALDNIEKNRMMRSNEDRENEKKCVKELLDKRPHNIRSLKYALQDFERVYRILIHKDIPYMEKWLFSFISYEMCFKAGLSSNGGLFSTKNESILYPGYYDNKYITKGIKKWVKNGSWSKEELDKELNYVLERDRNLNSVDKVCTNRILDLEDSDIVEGFPSLLELAYAGELELDDYVNLIENSAWARKHGIPIPEIDWEKVCVGIRKQIDFILKKGEDSFLLRKRISGIQGDMFKSEEKRAYSLIDDFHESKELMFRNNRNLYIKLMKENPLNALVQTQNKQFNMFDEEMANVTADGFEKISNADRNRFIYRFENMWKTNIESNDYKLTENGFLVLKARISNFLEDCVHNSLYITKTHAFSFIEIINRLINMIKNK